MSAIEHITAQNTKTQASSQKLNQDFDDFLTLLTTQLQNQDPLEPMDTSEFTNQLVQFSGVEQQLRTNDTLEDMRALGMLQITDIGLGFVGMDVQMAGDTFDFDGASEVELSYELPEASKNTNISIKNADGDSVYSMDGEIIAGQKEFIWDGKNRDGFAVPPGQYTFEVSAQNIDGKSMNVSTQVPGKVNGIESDGTGNVMLVIGNQKVPITDVTRATLPNEIAQTVN
jgi:flagellar basal-body rod modification protein FlgD